MEEVSDGLSDGLTPECTHRRADGTSIVIKHAMPDGSLWSRCVKCSATDRGDGKGWRKAVVYLPPPLHPTVVPVAGLDPGTQRRLGRTTGVVSVDDPALKPVARPDAVGRKIR